MNITNGKHKILFSLGKLYLDDVQIGGEGISPSKDIIFEFEINKPDMNKDPSILEINVVDSIRPKDLGPGQQ